MGEGRHDRSGKRKKFSHGKRKSFSDSELAQEKRKGRKGKPKEKWHMLSGLTVDELARYRRRRVKERPKDNLGLDPEAEFQEFVSEYREAFRARSEEFLKENTWSKVDKNLENPREKNASTVAPFLKLKETETKEKTEKVENKKSTTSLPTNDEEITMGFETMNCKTTEPHPTRPSLIRRGTTLKYGGELYTDTETYSSYIAYEGHHRPELARRPTSLKMEGKFATTTEKCEKFIEWLNVSRPELTRVKTHLKLEGDLSTMTENNEKYVPFVGAERRKLLRQNTNLKLEGESNFLPEYTDMYKGYDVEEFSKPMKSDTDCKADKSTLQRAEAIGASIDLSTTEIKTNDDPTKVNNREEKKRNGKKNLLTNLEESKCPPFEIPEYKDAYKNFPRERPKIIKPEGEIGRADGSKIYSLSVSKPSTRIDLDPEYKSKYLDYHRDYPIYRKPPLISKTTFIPVENCPKRQDNNFTSEVRAQYVPYGRVSRVETLKMPSNLRLEGNLDLQPEYRMAYCMKHENQQVQSDKRIHRRRDRSSSASKRRNSNHWMNNNTEESTYADNDKCQDAFQVLNTRIHDGAVPIGRRGSKLSPSGGRRGEALNSFKDTTTPTYRLQVCNVDDKPKTFHGPQSPSFQSSDTIRNRSPDRVFHDEPIRNYSPSFGKSITQENNGQSFVVLDNETFDLNGIRRRRTDRNYNIDGASSICKGKPRNSSNWMEPWYDSTNTI